jgi:hypothetical protein
MGSNLDGIGILGPILLAALAISMLWATLSPVWEEWRKNQKSTGINIDASATEHINEPDIRRYRAFLFV